ncbi:TPA_asm: P3 [Dryobalanops betacytorhabdovirus 1]|nr:TPA_asm: P3 [Dryobalanops betacytorhabdovirus 1]
MGDSSDKKIKENKLFSIDLKKEVVQNVIPYKIPFTRLQKLFTDYSVKTVKCSEITIDYTPLMSQLEGSIIVNVYDNRLTNPRSKLLLHTAFPVGSSQYINISPGSTFAATQITDDIIIEIFCKDVEVKSGVSYGKIKSKCSFSTHNKATTGGVPMMSGEPALYYSRGDLLSAEDLASLTKEFNFVGPPLVMGRSYVIKGEGRICKQIGSKEVIKNPGDKYTRVPIYNENDGPIV